jgi:hypothetical protein
MRIDDEPDSADVVTGRAVRRVIAGGSGAVSVPEHASLKADSA